MLGIGRLSMRCSQRRNKSGGGEGKLDCHQFHILASLLPCDCFNRRLLCQYGFGWYIRPVAAIDRRFAVLYDMQNAQPKLITKSIWTIMVPYLRIRLGTYSGLMI
jgi:hypothetical protein